MQGSHISIVNDKKYQAGFRYHAFQNKLHENLVITVYNTDTYILNMG
jgi:hypothetical protein